MYTIGLTQLLLALARIHLSDGTGPLDQFHSFHRYGGTGMDFFYRMELSYSLWYAADYVYMYPITRPLP